MSRNLLQLMRDNLAQLDNRANGAQKIRAEAADDGVHLYVYDFLDAYFGCSAEDLIAGLAGTAGKTIHLHINSPGGSVFEGRAMSAALVAHQGDVIAHIDGVCASAATYLALAASQVRMTEGALFMIHNSMGMAFGNKDEMRATADLLEKVDGQIANDYAKKTGKPVADIEALMDAETWFTPEEALAEGFVDVIDTNTKADKKNLAGAWNLSAYANAPKTVKPPAPTQVELDKIEAALAADIAAVQQRNRNRLRLLERS